ncbi:MULTISPECIES: PaaX family transcriptional regulator [Protofrankia]|uniref:PaaX family transcriptional regulator n=1 Tax=Protofrankia TaxID=2994361 RepID=UPI0002DA0FBC|nr:MULTISPECIES: PaaX family transcriptional regulator C-terminal domain-containing protein [Protofrankia]
MVITGPVVTRDHTSKVDLPRFRLGAQPQRLLMTLLGDYWHGCEEHIPSAALVRLLADFDISTVGARAALSRLARRGLLESSRVGRNTYYGLTGQAAEALQDSAVRVLSFGQAGTGWDGRWVVAAFSLPEEQRDIRHAVRNRLRWLGFAPLYDGMWVSPRQEAEAVIRMFAELGVPNATVLTAVEATGVVETAGTAGTGGMSAMAVAVGPRRPIEAWDLTELRARYEDFIRTHTLLLGRIRAADVDPAEALVARTAVLDAWRRFPGLDPDLPLKLLPPQWPRVRAHAVFAEIYDELAPFAVDRVRQVIFSVAPDLAGLVRHHTATRPSPGRHGRQVRLTGTAGRPVTRWERPPAAGWQGRHTVGG